MKGKKTILTIAGSDPSGGAGAQADLSTFASHGLYGLSVLTAVTAQNFTEVKASFPVPSRLVKAQIDSLLDEFTPLAVKVGMTGTASNIRAICGAIKASGIEHVVVDTVMASTLGFRLLDAAGVKELKRLIGLSTVATPNIPEACALSGMSISSVTDMEEACRVIYALGPSHVLLKGGHLEGDPVDLLFDGMGFQRFRGRRLKGDKRRFHGTGCVLSSAIASNLALGRSVADSVGLAREYLHRVLEARR